MIRPSWLTESSGSSKQTAERDAIEAPSLGATNKQQGQNRINTDGDNNEVDNENTRDASDEQALFGAKHE